MKKQPLNLSVGDGNGEKLLYSFCKYAETHNPPDVNDPHHWDISIYLTGIDIYEMHDQKSYFYKMEIAKSDGLCNSSKFCAAAEFGITITKVYSGFTIVSCRYSRDRARVSKKVPVDFYLAKKY